MSETRLREDLTQWLAGANERLAAFRPEVSLEHIGTVRHVGDTVAVVTGLPRTRLGEVLRFADGTPGLVLRVDEDSAGCVLLGRSDLISAGMRVYGTGEIVRVPVGEDLQGRVLDPLGMPLDGGEPVKGLRYDSVERPAPAIVDRDLVTVPLLTGLCVVDAMVPLGRGQRQLILGDRKTGKTALAVDTVISQRSSQVVCVYCFVGQKMSSVHRAIEAVRKHGAPERCIFVVGEAETPPGMQWIAPYAACTMAEFFRDQGRDALLVIDDLSKHAIVYRQLSLLLRRPPGREAYPGDIFYTHARLLERAAHLGAELGGGSLSALAIAETQAGNLSAYIPTNLISITDGQIYLDPKLFYEGQKPAVNVGLSVSRVGGQTQAPAMKRLADTLRLEYAQFLELEVFTRFGAMLDARTGRTIEHGRRIRAILSQREYRPLSQSAEVVLLLALHSRILDDIALDRIPTFLERIAAHLPLKCPDVLSRIDASGELTDADEQALIAQLKTESEKLKAESEQS